MEHLAAEVMLGHVKDVVKVRKILYSDSQAALSRLPMRSRQLEDPAPEDSWEHGP